MRSQRLAVPCGREVQQSVSHAARMQGAGEGFGAVLEGAAHHGGGTLKVQADAAILVLVVLEVADHLALVLGREHSIQHPSDVAGDEQARHEEHGPPVVCRKVACVHLQALLGCNACPQAAADVIGRAGARLAVGHLCVCCWSGAEGLSISSIWCSRSL